LHVRGTLPRPGIAIVGSRTPSAEAETFAYELARKLGEPIVSGLAPGIDVAAHRGALSAGAPMHAMRFAKELEKPRFAVMPPEEMKLRPEWAGNLACIAKGATPLPFDLKLAADLLRS
jgi:hypothetical protein